MHFKTYIRVVAVLVTVVLLTMVSDFLALNDIFRDYVSLDALRSTTGISPVLPSWTMATLEWKWLEIMFVIRLLAVVGILFALYQLMSKQSERFTSAGE